MRQHNLLVIPRLPIKRDWLFLTRAIHGRTVANFICDGAAREQQAVRGRHPRRRHLCRYGEVVQFTRPTDADQHHVNNGLQVRIARAEPRPRRPGYHHGSPQYKPLSERTYVVDKWRYRVGDKLRISFGPLGKNYQECESVNRIKGFGCIVDNTLIFDCLIGYISEDGKECLIRWPPEKHTSDCETGQGCIRQSCGSLKDFAEFSSSGDVSESQAGRSQTWWWLLT